MTNRLYEFAVFPTQAPITADHFELTKDPQSFQHIQMPGVHRHSCAFSIAAISWQKEGSACASAHEEGSLQGWMEGIECLHTSPNPRRKHYFLTGCYQARSVLLIHLNTYCVRIAMKKSKRSWRRKQVNTPNKRTNSSWDGVLQID